MTVIEAKEVLSKANRWELRDHAFGDREVGWDQNGKEIASGYFSGCTQEVGIVLSDGSYIVFDGADASELAMCGTLGTVERNDETGPEEYVQGQVMPGLTLEGVRKELCGE